MKTLHNAQYTWTHIFDIIYLMAGVMGTFQKRFCCRRESPLNIFIANDELWCQFSFCDHIFRSDCHFLLVYILVGYFTFDKMKLYAHVFDTAKRALFRYTVVCYDNDLSTIRKNKSRATKLYNNSNIIL